MEHKLPSLLFLLLLLPSFSSEEAQYPNYQGKDILALHRKENAEFFKSEEEIGFEKLVENFRDSKEGDKLVPMGIEWYEENQYDLVTRNLMGKQIKELFNPSLSGICTSSFEYETGIFLIENEKKRELVILKANQRIWLIFSDQRMELPESQQNMTLEQITFWKRTIPLSAEVAQQLHHIWYNQLAAMTYDPRMGLLNGFDGHSYQFSMGVGPPSINLNGTQACIARKNILCLIMDNMIAQRETLTSETIPDLIQKAYRTKEKENEEIALKKDKAPE